MTSDQFDRLLGILDRYVTMEEQKFAIGVEQLSVRNAMDEKAVAAQEKMAEGVKISGDMRAHHVRDEPGPVSP